MPAFVTNGNLAYRLGGQGFDTGQPIGTVRDGQWHHIAATKSGTAGALYVDGELVHSSPTGAGSQLATGPWHVMRNGTNAVFSEGEADEVALYTRALERGRDPEPLRPGQRPRRRRAAGRARPPRRAAAGGQRTRWRRPRPRGPSAR